MGAANPANGQDENNLGKPSESSFLLWLIRNGPPWARMLAIGVGLLVAVAPTLLLVFNWVPPLKRQSVAEPPTATQLQLGVSGQLNAARAKLAEKLKAAVTQDDKNEVLREFGDLNHEIDHLSNPIDEAVRWTIFEKKASGDYWGYKLLPSDGCLLVTRVENNSALSQWVRDPLRPAPSASASHGQTVTLAARDDLAQPEFGSAFYRLADLRGIAQEQGPVPLRPVQGTCMNPHPWIFQETWGAYINQCQQPVFRRWNDGCTHVQMFDHCQNIWGPVVWQFCAISHHP